MRLVLRQVVMTLVSPDKAVVSTLTVTAHVGTEVKVSYSIRHIQSVEGALLQSYKVPPCPESHSCFRTCTPYGPQRICRPSTPSAPSAPSGLCHSSRPLDPADARHKPTDSVKPADPPPQMKRPLNEPNLLVLER
eukprot:285800-Rhodomonas_salina.3